MKKNIFITLIIFFISTNLFCKIGDPPAIIKNTIKFQSHENYVESIDLNTNNIIWKTVVYTRCYPIIEIPFFESDVSWNIISDIKLNNNNLEVYDSRNNKYILDIKYGKMINKEIKTYIILFPIEILILVLFLFLIVLIILVIKNVPVKLFCNILT